MSNILKSDNKLMHKFREWSTDNAIKDRKKNSKNYLCMNKCLNNLN